ncbi:peptidoglycan binding domain containing protein [Diplodia corticola]|uniref:Peptidoglycan binding domain containing protein n=1 Tax=Diplodia corticola TaxID=236234 RepID=A0A1J9QQU7_9PEZI|nr:peptidoglycan binding domain containing protein [Diplodia corticola]OJD30832.1 peptidoglycan binding domain containing protein [Diplodia corticola]
MYGDVSNLNRPKKLIVCCDGTWIDSDNSKLEDNGTLFHPKLEVQDPSNVTRIGRALPCSDSQQRPQIVYYQAGVGTGPSLVEKLVGGSTGSGLSENVREAYGFLANNYQDGDAVYLTGFSRGAFTARCIVALIDAVGLLTKTAMRHFYRVFKDFERAGEDGYGTSITEEVPEFHIEISSAGKSLVERRKEYLAQYFKELKRLHKTREIPIQAIGVWDTVGALGIPTIALLQRIGLPAFLADPLMTPNPYRFTDTTIGKNVRYAFQALALDERRSAFTPTIWEQPDSDSDDDNDESTRPGSSRTVLKQVWFPGVHTDVGGSEADSGLADVSLAWMMSQLETAGLEFDETYLADQWRLNRLEYADRAAAAASSHRNPTFLATASATLLRLLRSPLSLLPLLPLPQSTSTTPKHHHKTPSSPSPSSPPPYSTTPPLDPSEPHWALTRLHSSSSSSFSFSSFSSFLSSLSFNVTALGGLAPRHPLATHRTSYETGRPLPALLRNTHERVHASVRARVQVGTYGADALMGPGGAGGAGGWVLEKVEEGGKEGKEGSRWRWVNRGGGGEVRGKVLEEDELGRLEVVLLREDREMAGWVLGRGGARVVGEGEGSSAAASAASVVVEGGGGGDE